MSRNTRDFRVNKSHSANNSRRSRNRSHRSGNISMANMDLVRPRELSIASAEGETPTNLFGRQRRRQSLGPKDLFVHSIEHDVTPPFSADAELYILHDPYFHGLHNIDNCTADDRRARYEKRKFALRVVIRHAIEDRNAPHIIDDDGVFEVLESMLKEGVWSSTKAFRARFGNEADRILLAIQARRFITDDIGQGTAENTMLFKNKREVLQIVLDEMEKPVWEYIDDTNGLAKKKGHPAQFDLSRKNYLTYFQEYDNDPLFHTQRFVGLMSNLKDVRTSLDRRDDLTTGNIVTAAKVAIKIHNLFGEIRGRIPLNGVRYLDRLIEIMREWEEKEVQYDKTWNSILADRFRALLFNKLAGILLNSGLIGSVDEEIYLEEERLKYQKGEIACRFLQERHYRKKLMGDEVVKFLKGIFKGRRQEHEKFPWADMEARYLRLATTETSQNSGGIDPYGPRNVQGL